MKRKCVQFYFLATMVVACIISTMVFNIYLNSQPDFESGIQNWPQNLVGKNIINKIKVKNSSARNLRRSPEEENRYNILIAASMRTGSSFLGEIFKQNKMFFYMYEPFKSIYDTEKDPSKVQIKIVQFLIDIFKCNFSSHEDYVDWFNQRSAAKRQSEVPSLFPLGKCHRSLPFRPRPTIFITGEPGRPAGKPSLNCPPVTVKDMEAACRSYTHTAVKTIRLKDVRTLLHSYRPHKRERVAIILLVRDPRAKASSQIPIDLTNYSQTWYKDTVKLRELADYKPTARQRIQEYCEDGVKNSKTAKSTLVRLGSYRIVRFEDLASNPQNVTREIYKFLKLNPPGEVYEWIENNTRATPNRNDPQFVYSTSRNSSGVISAWRNRITFELVQKIQSQCSAFMKEFKYTFLSSERELQDRSISLF